MSMEGLGRESEFGPQTSTTACRWTGTPPIDSHCHSFSLNDVDSPTSGHAGTGTEHAPGLPEYRKAKGAGWHGRNIDHA